MHLVVEGSTAKGGTMNTRDLDSLSRNWSERDLSAAVGEFVRRQGRLPRRVELSVILLLRRATASA